jgi:hypothetical protein
MTDTLKDADGDDDEKGKCKVFLCFIKHHASKACWGR